MGVTNLSKISVIVPAYNTGKYIDKCLDSILAQTMDDIEVIIVEQNSTDDTYKRARYWADKDNRIKIVVSDKRGLSLAKNIGIAASDSVFICFIDSDDYIDSKMIECLYNAIVKHDADISFCNIYTDNFETGEVMERAVPFKTGKPLNVWTTKDVFVELSPSSCNKMFKKSLFFDNNTFFDNKLFHCEDWLCFFSMLPYVKRIVHIDKPLYYYLIYRPGSLITTPSEDNISQVIQGANKLFAFYKDRNLYEDFKEQLNTIITTFLMGRTKDFFYIKKGILSDMNVFLECLESIVPNWKDYIVCSAEAFGLYKYLELCNLIENADELFRNKPVIIFSASKGGKTIYDMCKKHNIKINAFCDNAKDKQGGNIDGVEIIATEDIREMFGDDLSIIFAADSRYYDDVRRQLNNLGITDDKIF